MSMITLPITEVRNNFLDLVRESKEIFERVIITKKGKPEAVLMSYDEFEGWMETLEISSDPELAAGIEEAKADIKAGKIYSYKDVISKVKKRKKRSKK